MRVLKHSWKGSKAPSSKPLSLHMVYIAAIASKDTWMTSHLWLRGILIQYLLYWISLTAVLRWTSFIPCSWHTTSKMFSRHGNLPVPRWLQQYLVHCASFHRTVLHTLYLLTLLSTIRFKFRQKNTLHQFYISLRKKGGEGKIQDTLI